MSIQDVLWKLHAVGDSSITEKETREAVKETARVLSELHNLCNLGSGEDLGEIVNAVRALAIGGMGQAFHRDYVAVTVGNLRARNFELECALQDCDEQRHADPLESERRMIQAALSGVDKEYGSQYFKVEG